LKDLEISLIISDGHTFYIEDLKKEDNYKNSLHFALVTSEQIWKSNTTTHPPRRAVNLTVARDETTWNSEEGACCSRTKGLYSGIKD
jgi:hypothetical protein